MKKILIVLIAILFVQTSFAHSDGLSKRIINKGEIVNEITNNHAKIIIGEGATIIIKSNNETNAKVLATIVDLRSGGKIKELTNADINTELSKDENEESKTAINQEIALPTDFIVEKAYPNPFNPVVSISYGLPTNSEVRILIHDLSGRKISEYTEDNKSSGWHEYRWDATDLEGNSIGSGVYLLTIQASDMVKKQKLTFIK